MAKSKEELNTFIPLGQALLHSGILDELNIPLGENFLKRDPAKYYILIGYNKRCLEQIPLEPEQMASLQAEGLKIAESNRKLREEKKLQAAAVLENSDQPVTYNKEGQMTIFEVISQNNQSENLVKTKLA